jgi:hypothetical protein
MLKQLANQSDSSGLRFNSAQDALDFATNRVKEVQRRVLTNRLGFAERYNRGDFEICLCAAVGPNSEQYDLIFSGIPLAYDEAAASNVACEDVGAPEHGYAGGNWNEWPHKPVLVDVVQLVEDPNKVIPSLMRLERHKERDNFIRNIFASSPTYDVRAEFVGTIGNWEVSVLGANRAGSDGTSVPGLVQGVSEVRNGVLGDVSNSPGDWFVKPEFKNFISGLTIYFVNKSVRVCLQEGSNFQIQICDMFLSPRQAVAGAIKNFTSEH